MLVLSVDIDGAERAILFSAGSTVRTALESAEVRIRSGCRGDGACGLCLVRVESGTVRNPNRTEILTLSPEQINDGIRLACQLVPESDLSVSLVTAATASPWRELAPEELPLSPVNTTGGFAGASAGRYGLAVDLGTTNISLSLRDLRDGRRVFSRVGPNPQSRYGFDVVSRLVAATESPDNARDLAGSTIAEIARETLASCFRHGLSGEDIGRVLLVGNTAMTVLLSGTAPDLLLEPKHWAEPVEIRPPDAVSISTELGIDRRASVEIAAPVAGFVGSDLLAGVLAADLARTPGAVLIDFGTNSEIALWDGRTLWVTSAAGGPAFESSQTRCGMPAEPGAVYRVELAPVSGQWDLRVIGGGIPKGFCGSGLVDLLGLLRQTGRLSVTGSFAGGADGITIRYDGDHPLRLTKSDVDMFQRAKAAIGAGLEKLLTLAGIRRDGISRLCIAGTFGQHLNVEMAEEVGLLPGIPAERVELCGNTALAGAELLLLSQTAAADEVSLRRSVRMVNLANEPDFDDVFLDNLYLRRKAKGWNNND